MAGPAGLNSARIWALISGHRLDKSSRYTFFTFSPSTRDMRKNYEIRQKQDTNIYVTQRFWSSREIGKTV